MDFNAGQEPAEMRRRPAEPAQPVLPEPARELVDVERVQSRIASEHFPSRTCGRVALENARDVISKSIEHGPMLGYPTISVNYCLRTFCKAFSKPLRMFTSSRSIAGTRENRRRRRSGSLDPLARS